MPSKNTTLTVEQKESERLGVIADAANESKQEAANRALREFNDREFPAALDLVTRRMRAMKSRTH